VAKTKTAHSLFDFGPVADRYEQWYGTAAGKMYDRLEKAGVTKLLPPSRPGNRLLDVGCGTGHWSRFFASKGFEVTGIDISPEMIKVARLHDNYNCHFQVLDACSLPFDYDSFDLVTAMTTLEFVQDIDTCLRKMFRCLRSNGKALIGVLNSLAKINRRRVAEGEQPYASARLLSPAQLRSLLEPFGHVRIHVVGFVSRYKSMIFLAPLVERISLWLGRTTGAFIIAEVYP